jgi:hypothetical protein
VSLINEHPRRRAAPARGVGRARGRGRSPRWPRCGPTPRARWRRCPTTRGRRATCRCGSASPWPSSSSGCRGRRAAHRHHHPRAGHRPRVPAGQEPCALPRLRPRPRPGHGVLPGGHRGPVHRRPAGRARRHRARAQDRRRLAARAVRQRPRLRCVVAPVGGDDPGVRHRHGGPQPRAADARRHAAPARADHRRAALPRRRGCRAAAVRAARLGRRAGPGARGRGATPTCRCSTSPCAAWCASPTRSPTCTCWCRCSTTRSTTGSATTRSTSCSPNGGDWLAAHPDRELVAQRYPRPPPAPRAARARAAGRGRGGRRRAARRRGLRRGPAGGAAPAGRPPDGGRGAAAARPRCPHDRRPRLR